MMIPLKYNLRSLAVRRTTTAATAFGIALVVFVLSSSLMLSAGVKKTLGNSGRADVAIVLRKGSDAELGSGVEEPQVGLIKSMPGVKKDGDKPIGVGEVVVVLALEKLGADGVANVQVRGTTDAALKLRPAVTIVDGRMPTPGSDEAMVGARIRGRFRGLEIGQRLELKKNRYVKVVGVFTDAGSSHESEVWTDLDMLRSTFGREGSVSSVRVLLESEGAFDGFQTAVEQDKRLGLMATRETKYYEKQSEGTALFISVLGSVIAFFFSLGAMIGAMNTMYASIANRQREIGTLRALGFSRTAILTSFLIEGIVLSALGGLVGAVASLGMGAVKFSMMNFASWSEMVFSFEPTPQVMGTALGAALMMGFVGGLLPAVKAAGVSPLAAMRG